MKDMAMSILARADRCMRPGYEGGESLEAKTWLLQNVHLAAALVNLNIGGARRAA